MTLPNPDPNAAVIPPVTPDPDPVTTVNLPDPVAQAKAEAAEWQKRFAGLQGKYQQEQQKWAETAARLLTLDEENKKLSGDLEAKLVDFTKIDEEKDTYLTELEVKNAELERLKIVTKEFPHLVPLLGETEEQDALPDGTGDELRTKLKTLSEKIESMKKGAQLENQSGASPDNPPATIKGSEALLRQAITAMHEGKMDEYNNLYAQYIEQSKNPGG